ncbi:MAG TPA: hypothetical protein VF857_02230 [Spirochaetota bacterium]
MKIKAFISHADAKIRAYYIVSKELYNRAKIRTREFISYMKSSDSDPVYAAAGYFPFVGWLIPMYLRENSPLCQKNAKQGLLLSLFAALFLVVLFFIELLIPSNLKVVSFVLIVLTYIFNFGYLTLSAYAMYTAAYKRIAQIPWISNRSESIQL